MASNIQQKKFSRVMYAFPTEAYIYKELAYRIDYLFKKHYGVTAIYAIKRFKKENKTADIPAMEEVIRDIIRDKFRYYHNFPRLQKLDDICRIGGFSLLDVMFLVDPDTIKLDPIKKDIAWASFDKKKIHSIKKPRKRRPFDMTYEEYKDHLTLLK